LNLAVLLCNFWTLASTSQCLRFLRDYGLPWNKAQGRSHVFQTKRLALKLSRQSWDAHARRALGSNAHFMTEHRDGFIIHRLRRDDLDVLLDELLPNPDRVVNRGTPVAYGHNPDVVRVRSDGSWYVLQRCHDHGWRSQLGNVWRRSQAQRSWINTWAMRMRHLPVPEPLIYMEKRHFRLLERSYLLTEDVIDAQPLSTCWQALDAAQRRDTLIHLGMELGRLHRFGGIHGNLTWNNLLITFAGGHPRVTMVGLDAARMIPAASRARCLLDMRVFLRDLEDRDPDGRCRRLFLDTWKRWSR
jgi:tRNA A-37 threonylcarbamoyl transferase component Bud32